MIRKTVLLISLVCAWSLLFSERLAGLQEVMDVYSVSVAGSQLYIGGKSTVSLYSMKNFKLIKKFGRRGEGPGEFRTFPMLKVFPGLLVINCFGKFLHFSPDGDFIMEKRLPNVFTLFIYPVGENFVGMKVHSDRKNNRFLRSIVLFNKDMKLIKEISKIEKEWKRKETGKRLMNAIDDYFRHEVYDENIFVANTGKGFFIEVFDSRGNKRYEINNDKKIAKLKVTAEYKKDFIENLKNSNDPFDKMAKRRIKYAFREYFPAFKEFTVNNGKIYTFTYKKGSNGKEELIVMDMKGKILKKVFVTEAKYYSISNDRYFYLKDNADKEEWEIFEEKIQ